MINPQEVLAVMRRAKRPLSIAELHQRLSRAGVDLDEMDTRVVVWELIDHAVLDLTADLQLRVRRGNVRRLLAP